MSARQSILAAGLSPAWQQMVVLDELRPGHVHRAKQVCWCASGKVVNVGRALHSLAQPQRTLSISGGEPGSAMVAELSADAVSTRWIRTAAATRVCTTIVDRGKRCVTELVENAAPISPNELSAFRQAYLEEVATAALVVLTGSLPRGTSPDWYGQLLAQTTCPAILDCRGEALLASLVHRPLVVKPNREELGQTFGLDFDQPAGLRQAIEKLRQHGAEWVIMTQGSQPTLVVGEAGRWWVRPPTVESVNPIGCGDCFTAGLATHLLRHARDVRRPTVDEMLAAARFGTAAAAENAGSLLPARLDPEQVQRRCDDVSVEIAD